MTDAPVNPPPRRRMWLVGGLAVAVLVVVAATSPWWGRRAMSALSFFRVRRVEIEGARYLSKADVLALLRVDTMTSVWADVAPLERRVASHPQVQAVTIRRKLPGTFVVRVTETLPVALLPGPGGLRPIAEDGRTLPIDPTTADVDLPVVAARDTALLRLLAHVRMKQPALFARISEARRAGRGEVVLHVNSLPVRATLDLTAERLAQILPVERDLARRGAHVAELDLRYRDQVVARLQ